MIIITATEEEIVDLKTLFYQKNEVYTKTEDSENFEEWIEEWLTNHLSYIDGVLLISY